MKPPRWTDEDAVIAWGVDRFNEIRGKTASLDGVCAFSFDVFSPPPQMPSVVHEMMLNFILAEENRKVLAERTALPETEAGIREAALSGWTEPLALLLQQHDDPVEGYPVVERIAPETWQLVREIVRGERNPKTGKRKGERGPRKKTAAERRAKTPTHDAADFVVPIIRMYLAESYPKQDGRQIYDRALEIAARIKGVKAGTVADHQKRGRRDRHRAP